MKSPLSGLKIGILGVGNMGQALVRGLVEKSVYPQNIRVFDVDKKKLAALGKETHARIAPSARQCASLSDVVILAVKPDILQQLIEEVGTAVGEATLVISIAAGVPIARIESFFKKPVSLVRVMPNMPAQVGQGISALSPSRHVTQRQKKVAQAILNAFGEVIEVPERMLDLVTAVSGSGPAYFFLLAEKMIEAAYELGMKVDVAKKLVYQTALGSGRVMVDGFEDPELLISKVASKGGTTEAALKVFQKQGFGKVVYDAVKAANKRSIQMKEAK